jgi:methylglutaconyl-CoA hydratase
VVATDALDAKVAEIVTALLQGGPRSQGAAKALIRAVADQPVSDALVEDTAAASPRCAPRRSPEGLGAFLDKRPASWVAGG